MSTTTSTDILAYPADPPHPAPGAAPSRRAGGPARFQSAIRWVSIAVILLGLFWLARGMPIAEGVDRLDGVVRGLGFSGYLLFGAVYVLAAVLLLPGSALTLAAGAIFGLAKGFLVVVVSATSAAALAFLIARYFARDSVARAAGRYPKFAAVDEAVGEGGGKVVALLRLSPVVPYSISNYLFGLTRVRFGSYLLASFVGMMPGTFLYVYLGNLAADAAVGAGGAGRAGAWRWTFYILGLLATLLVTLYLTRSAQRKLRDRTVPTTTTTTAADVAVEAPRPAGPRAHQTGTWILALVALLVVTALPFRADVSKAITGLFGPPPVRGSERYAHVADDADFDHSALDELLRRHVDAEGFVDYAALKTERAQIDAYAALLAGAPFAQLGRDEKLALLINAYNAFTLQLILDHYPVASIRDIDDPWGKKRYALAGATVSLDEIEHEMIRKGFAEPRIHFALVCAAFSCPPLRSEAYVGERLEEQFAAQTRDSLGHPRWLRLDGGTLRLTKIMDWYGGDFERAGGAVQFVGDYNAAVKRRLDAGERLRVDFLDYDWALNSKENRKLLDRVAGR